MSLDFDPDTIWNFPKREPIAFITIVLAAMGLALQILGSRSIVKALEKKKARRL